MAAYRPAIPGGSVIITPNQMYREVVATRNAVSDLSAKFDEVPATLTDLETRMRSVEGRIWVASGVASVVAAAAAIVLPLITR